QRSTQNQAGADKCSAQLSIHNLSSRSRIPPSGESLHTFLHSPVAAFGSSFVNWKSGAGSDWNYNVPKDGYPLRCAACDLSKTSSADNRLAPTSSKIGYDMHGSRMPACFMSSERAPPYARRAGRLAHLTLNHPENGSRLLQLLSQKALTPPPPVLPLHLPFSSSTGTASLPPTLLLAAFL